MAQYCCKSCGVTVAGKATAADMCAGDYPWWSCCNCAAAKSGWAGWARRACHQCRQRDKQVGGAVRMSARRWAKRLPPAGGPSRSLTRLAACPAASFPSPPSLPLPAPGPARHRHARRGMRRRTQRSKTRRISESERPQRPPWSVFPLLAALCPDCLTASLPPCVLCSRWFARACGRVAASQAQTRAQEQAVTRAQARAKGEGLEAHTVIAEARQTADEIIRKVCSSLCACVRGMHTCVRAE